MRCDVLHAISELFLLDDSLISWSERYGSFVKRSCTVSGEKTDPGMLCTEL